MADRIQIRRDTASNWTSANSVLAQGELGVETDTNKMKIGDGSTAWSSLGYLVDTGGYAAYADATANFTGTLQQGGSNVVVDSDIGSTVQAYDANLNSFISAVDLPTADGAASQILETDGAGQMQFVDPPSGAGFTNFNKGTVYDVAVRSADDITDLRLPASTSYTQFWRVGSNSTSNHTVGNTFSWITGLQRTSGGQSTAFTASGITVTPSTKTISVATPEQIWENPSYYGVSTWAGYGAEGGSEMVCGGHIAWTGETNYQFGYALYRQELSDGSSASVSQSGRTGDSHGQNGNYYSLPYNGSGATRALVVGYDQDNSSKASYRTYSGGGAGQNSSVGNVVACPNTNTSTVQAITMFTHPLITSAGLFPNSGSYNLPTHMCVYGTANGYSKIAIDAGNNVGAEVTTGFNRADYSEQTAFLVKDPNSTDLKLFNYSYRGQCCEWTSTTQTYDRGSWGTMLPFNINAHKTMLIPTGNLNEYMILGSQSYPYYAPMAFSNSRLIMPQANLLT